MVNGATTIRRVALHELRLVHKRLSSSEEIVAVQTLAHYLLAGSIGDEWGKFNPDRSDVARYFPSLQTSCDHCKETNNSLVLIEASLLFVLPKVQSPSQKENFLLTLKSLDNQIDHRIHWMAILKILELDWDELLVSEILWNLIKSASVSQSVVEYLSLDYLKSVKKILDIGELQVKSRPHIKPRDLRIRELYYDLFNGNVNQVLSSIITDPDVNHAIWKIITPNVLSSGDQENFLLWIDARIAGLQFNSRDLSALFEYLVQSNLQLDPRHREKIKDLVRTLKNTYSLSAALRYAMSTLDFDFGLDVIREISEENWWANPVITHELILFLTQIDQTELLISIFKRDTLIKFIDLRTFEFLIFLANQKRNSHVDLYQELVEIIETYATKNLEEIDRGVLLLIYASKPGLFNQNKAELFEIFKEDKSVNSLLVALNNEKTRFALSRSIYHLIQLNDDLVLLIKNLNADLDVMIKELEAVSRFIKNVKSDFYFDQFEFENLLKNLSLESSHVFSEELIKLEFRESVGEALVRLLEKFAEVNYSLTKSLIEDSLVFMCTNGVEENQRKLLSRILNVTPMQFAQKCVKSALISIAKSKSETNLGWVLREISNQFGIKIDTAISALLINSELSRGDVFEVNTITGPPTENWNQLAIILDDVVHELNQPIASLANWVRTLSTLKEQGKIDLTSVELAIEKMQKSLLVLGERMTVYGSLTSGGTSNTWINSKDLIFEVVEAFKESATDKGINLALTTSHLRSFWIFGNPFQLRLALRSLLINAIQSTEVKKSDRRIDVNVYNPPRRIDEVVIQVRDSGIGIPVEIQSKIFERGFTTKPGRGLGLGLSLTASVVNGMNGQIKLVSSGPTGSEFAIRIPSHLHPTFNPGFEDIDDQLLDFEVFENE